MTWIVWVGMYLAIGLMFAALLYACLFALAALKREDVWYELQIVCVVVLSWPLIIGWIVFFFGGTAFLEYWDRKHSSVRS